MKDYEVIDEMNRAVYEASNSRKVLRKLKKYLEANGYNVWFDSISEVLEVCPGDKSVVVDWKYAVAVMYSVDYGYKIASGYSSAVFVDDYCGKVMLDMVRLSGIVTDMVDSVAMLVNEEGEE